MKSLLPNSPKQVFGEFKNKTRTLVARTTLELVTTMGIKSSRTISTSSAIDESTAYSEIEKVVSTEDFYHVCDKVNTCLAITAPHSFVLVIGDVDMIVKRCFTFSGRMSKPVKIKALDSEQVISIIIA